MRSLSLAALASLGLALTALAHDAAAQRRSRARRRPAAAAPAAPATPATPPAAPARSDDPAASELPLGAPVNVTAAGNTLTLTGSRAWPVAAALAWLNEDGALTMLLHSTPVACPASLPERLQLANAMNIDCRGGACRMLLLQVPMPGGLQATRVAVRSPAALEQQVANVGATTAALDPNNPAAMQAAIAQLQQLATARPVVAALAWKNATAASRSDAATGGEFVVSAVQGSRFTGRFALTFDGPPSPRAVGAPSLDGTFSVTLCPR